MRVYADNAAMKPLLPEVKEVIHEFLDTDIRNPSAVYTDGRNTKKLIEASEIIGIPVLDHIIIDCNNYFSFLESGLLKKLQLNCV